ncbi:MAG TPA: carbohydrate ABC transporter permease [Pseudobacteroides sp.]|uniref:carbohydrate ABC transporter permease n=1 Tax=Pseudobacteroides sp. TaxID=1968840 RepID=UPI002F91C35A
MGNTINESTPPLKNLHNQQLKRKNMYMTGKVLSHILLIAVSLFCLMPFYFMITYATRSPIDIAQGMAFFPGSEFLNNLERLTTIVDVLGGLKNSLIAAIPATFLSAYFGGITAYGFAKYNFKGKNYLFAVVFLSLIIPQQIGFVGFLKVCTFLNLKDTLWPLIIPYIANSLFVFFVKYYIENTIPDSLMDSARIDGCSELKIYHFIVLPAIIPAIATMSMFTFFSVWNSYLIPTTILESQSLYTVPIMTALSKGIYGNDFGAMYATLAVFTLPVILVYILCSRFLTNGVSLSFGLIKD